MLHGSKRWTVQLKKMVSTDAGIAATCSKVMESRRLEEVASDFVVGR